MSFFGEINIMISAVLGVWRVVVSGWAVTMMSFSREKFGSFVCSSPPRYAKIELRAFRLLYTKRNSDFKILFSVAPGKPSVDALTRFTYQTGTEVFHSCAATLNNEMFVFGGRNQKRQVIKNGRTLG